MTDVMRVDDHGYISPKGKTVNPTRKRESDVARELKENGVLVEYYVAKHDYEPDLNGSGRSLVVRR